MPLAPEPFARQLLTEEEVTNLNLIVTAGGILFIGATNDEQFRAFDAKTGDTLWKTKLPFGGYATPATYEVDGRQFVLIACGGGKMGTKSGNA